MEEKNRGDSKKQGGEEGRKDPIYTLKRLQYPKGNCGNFNPYSSFCAEALDFVHLAY